jgi:alpha-mannosidase
LDKHPQHKENLELDGFSYEAMKERNNACFNLLKKLASRRQIEIVGGSYSAPPMILVDGESNIRQLLFGRELIKQLFKVEVKCFAVQEGGMCINPQLPQMLRKTGYDNCVIGCMEDYLFVEGIGIDGTKVPTITKSYHDPLPRDPKTITEVFEKCQEHPARLVMPMPDWSWGAAKTEWITEAMRQKDLLSITVSEFFSRNKPKNKYLLSGAKWKPQTTITDLGAPRLSVLLDIGYGCEVPKNNKYSENLLLTAERFQAIASFLGLNPDFVMLEKCWKNLYKGQAHDTYFDGCIPSLKEWAIQHFKKTAKNAQHLLEEALQHITNHVDTQIQVPNCHLKPIIVFNQLSWERTELVELNQHFKKGEAYSVCILDREGKPVHHQIDDSKLYSDGSLKKLKIYFLADLPSLGFNTYYISFSERVNEDKHQTKTMRSNSSFIENKYLKVGCMNNGEIKIEDLQTSKEIFRGSFFTCNDEDGYDDSRRHPVKIRDAMTGNIESRLTVESQLRRSTHKTTITLRKNSKTVSFNTKIRLSPSVLGKKVVWWCMQPESALANNLIINVEDGAMNYDFPFGHGQTDSMMVFPLNWIDYSNSEEGVSVFHKGTHGFWIKSRDPLHLMNLWLWSQLEGQNWEKAGLLPKMGEYNYMYAVMPHKKGKTVTYDAFEYNNPPIIAKTSLHSGVLPKRRSFMKIEKNVILSAIIPKPNKALIRLYEFQGQKAKFDIVLNFSKVSRVQKVDVTGKKILRNLTLQGNSVSTSLNPHEIACYALS